MSGRRASRSQASARRGKRKASKVSLPGAKPKGDGGGGGMVLGNGVELGKMLGWDLRLARKAHVKAMQLAGTAARERRIARMAMTPSPEPEPEPKKQAKRKGTPSSKGSRKPLRRHPSSRSPASFRSRPRSMRSATTPSHAASPHQPHSTRSRRGRHGSSPLPGPSPPPVVLGAVPSSPTWQEVDDGGGGDDSSSATGRRERGGSRSSGSSVPPPQLVGTVDRARSGTHGIVAAPVARVTAEPRDGSDAAVQVDVDDTSSGAGQGTGLQVQIMSPIASLVHGGESATHADGRSSRASSTRSGRSARSPSSTTLLANSSQERVLKALRALAKERVMLNRRQFMEALTFLDEPTVRAGGGVVL